MWASQVTAFLLYLPLLVNGDEMEWGINCPIDCTCHMGSFQNVPMKRWLQDGENNDSQPTPLQKNEVFYEDDKLSSTGIKLMKNTSDELVKMAMCVFQKDTDPQLLLGKLPQDLQVLTMLQGRDSGEIVLEANHMQALTQLLALEIQGFRREGYDPKQHNPEDIGGKLVLRNDALHPLTTLQYLNLQHIKLLGHPRQGNKPAPVLIPVSHVNPLSNEIPVGTWNEKMKNMRRKGKRKEKLQRLVFLRPNEPDGKVLPYKVYKKQQEWAGISTFTGLTNLLFLRVFDCNIREINWEMFDGLNGLEHLSLEKNHLLFVPEFAFYGTPNLKILSLAHNKLLGLESTALAGLLELEKLDLSHNNFTHLSELSLPPFPKLRTADFTHNPIQAIFASTFEIMNATTTLSIGGEESTLNIFPNSFLGLQALNKLSIDNIGISLLERELLLGMSKLKELKITGFINGLSFDAFLELPKLETLTLRRCNIQFISMDGFYGLYGLLYLDLSSNLLKSLPPGLFDQQFSLKELLLQNNQLTELPVGLFNNVPAKMIRLDDNPWDCTCAMKDWQPAAINKVKQKKSPFCNVQYNKGSMCTVEKGDRYVYERRVAPRCATPNKYKGWSVFHVLRKQLRCTKKHHDKINRKAYLKKKYQDYEKSLKPRYHGETPDSQHDHRNIVGGKLSQNTNEKKNLSNLQDIDKLKNGESIKKQAISNYVPENVVDTDNVVSSDNANYKMKYTLMPIVQPTNSSPHIYDMTTQATPSPKTNKFRSKSSDVKLQEFANTVIFKSTTRSTTHGNSKLQGNVNTQLVQPSLLTGNREMFKINKLSISSKPVKFAKVSDTMKIDNPSTERGPDGMLVNVKEIMKPTEQTFVTYNNNKTAKLSKKAWKLELERKRQEKLKKHL